MEMAELWLTAVMTNLSTDWRACLGGCCWARVGCAATVIGGPLLAADSVAVIVGSIRVDIVASILRPLERCCGCCWWCSCCCWK